MSPLPLLLGVGWGALVAMPLARRAHRALVVSRLDVVDVAPRVSKLPRLARPLALQRWVNPVSSVIRGVVERRRGARRDAEMTRELPVVIDLLAVAVGAGCTPYLAVDVATHWAPAPLATCLDSVRHDSSLGVSFTEALERLAVAHAPLRQLVDALLASERYGAPVGEALARLAVEARATLRRSAESRARTISVRMLFPLVFLVLPAFALLSVVPALLAGLTST